MTGHSARTGFPPIVSQGVERVAALPPAATFDLSLTVDELRTAIRSGAVCLDGARQGLRALTRAGFQGAAPYDIGHALQAGVRMDHVLYLIDVSVPNAQTLFRLFAADCADVVSGIHAAQRPEDDRPQIAVATARKWALAKDAPGEVIRAYRGAMRAASDQGGTRGGYDWERAGRFARFSALNCLRESPWSAAGLALYSAERATRFMCHIATPSLERAWGWEKDMEGALGILLMKYHTGRTV